MDANDLDIHPKSPVNGNEDLSVTGRELVLNGPKTVVFPKPGDMRLSSEQQDLVPTLPKTVVFPQPQEFLNRDKAVFADTIKDQACRSNQ